jgi:hypothetical protein
LTALYCEIDPDMTIRIPAAQVHRMRAEGKSFYAIADHFGVNHMTIRRIVSPGYAPRSPYQPKPKPLEVEPVRITDYPTTLTAAICGDPTPQRRALIDNAVNMDIPSGNHAHKRTTNG